MAIRIPKDSFLAEALTFNPSAIGPGYAGGVYVKDKIHRASIVYNRESSGSGDAFGTNGINPPVNAYKEGRNEELYNKIKRSQRLGRNRSEAASGRNYNDWSISIVDVDYNSYFDEKAGRPRYIDLMYIPREVRESQLSAFAALKPIGRNNPHYQFTGSEDILEFEIDWHSHDIYRKDVIRYVRWLQALTKADGWDQEPHRIKLVWSTNPLIWRDDVWIVVSANPKFTQFSNKVKARQREVGFDPIAGDDFVQFNERIVDTNLLPVQAYQTIVLKKVTEYNLKSGDIGQFNTFKNR